jgi:hypothetical protein
MAKVTEYNMDKFHQGKNGFGLPFCGNVFSVTLAANTEATVAVPLTSVMGNITATVKNKFMAIFTCDGTVFACINATAAKPVGATLASVTSAMVPANCPWGRVVQAGDVIHVISGGTPNLTIEFYAIQE